MLSEMVMTIDMWCSTSNTVRSVTVPEVFHELSEFIDLAVGEPRCGFVEHQELRIAGQRPSDFDALQRSVG